MHRTMTWKSASVLILAVFSIPLIGTQAESLRPPVLRRQYHWMTGTASPPYNTTLVQDPSSDWWSVVRQEIQQVEYDVTWQEQVHLDGIEAAYQAPNRAQNLRTYFVADGPVLIPRTSQPEDAAPQWRLQLEVVAWGRQGALRPPVPPELHPDGHRIEYSRGGLVEWYANERRGLEQGFVIASPPDPVAVADGQSEGRALVVALALTGNLTPAVGPGGDTVDLLTADGETVLRYGDLQVSDSNGHRLPAQMRLVGPDTLHIIVDDAGAVYPIRIDPVISGLSTTADWTAESDQSDDAFFIVNTAGDVNGDGYSDVIVGAYLYDNGQTDEGRAFVYYGGPAGLSTGSADWTAEGNQADAMFGGSVGTAGDVNGDGYADVIVGAYAYDNGQTDEGRAFVYHGGPMGLTAGSADWTAESDQAYAGFGFDHALGTIGDVNGDGYSDVVVGAPYYDNGEENEGRAFVYHGGPTGLNTGPADWTAEGNEVGAWFGSAAGAAGDVNGDGYADVIIGAYGYDNFGSDQGVAFVYHGSASGLTTGPADWMAESDQDNSEFGISVSAAGDVNGDGYGDVIVGARAYDKGQTDEGVAFVYHGSATGLTAGLPDWTAESDQDGAHFGFAVSTAGDVNGDGYADVVVGAWLYDGSYAGGGQVYVYHGSLAGLATGAADWTTEGDEANAGLGYSVGVAGDVDGDGYSDIIVGAVIYDDVNYTYSGKVYVYRGASDGLSTTAAWTAESNQGLSGFGFSVGTAGDVNGDGHADVIVGAYRFDGGAGGGRAFIYYGSSEGPSTAADWIADGGPGSVHFGYSVGTAGDVNGDGYADVIIGAPLYHNGQNGEGQAVVYHGGPGGLTTGSADWTAESDQFNANFAHAVGTAGDVNGDGYGDVIIGAHQYNDGAGGVFVYHGSPGGLSVSPEWTAWGDQGGAYLGVSVGTAGDVNGDGFSDVVVGAYMHDNGETDEGRVFVYHGSTLGLGATPDWMAESDQAYAYFGFSVGTTGDVNGDGYADVIIGAPFYDDGEDSEGGAFVYHGGSSGLTSGAADWTAEGDNAHAHFGDSVGTAGDVNGDGYADAIVGAPYADNGQDDEGRVFVYHGGVAGLTTGSADWTAEGEQDSARFGFSVGTAGDVNGDGYADVIIGSDGFDHDQADEGRAFVYYGNDGAGLSLRPRQLRASGSAPIAPLGRSDSVTSLQLGLTGRMPLGRGQVKLEWQVAPLGTPFTATTAISGTGAVWTDVLTTGVAITQAITGLTPNTPYHWRARLLYPPGNRLGQNAGHWLHVPWNGWTETDFRTPSAWPELIGFAPQANDHTVPHEATVSITYDRAISLTTVNTQTFAVHAMQTGLQAEAYGLDSGTLNLTPAYPFKPGELVQVSATTRTLSLDGYGPISPTIWQFQAAVARSSGIMVDSDQRLGSSWSNDVALGDLDSDGDLDAYIATFGEYPDRVWFNDGAGNFTDSGQNIGNASSSAVALGDVDSDGDLDAFVGNNAQPHEIWLNDGHGTFTDSSQLPSASYSRDVALGDIDGDGDLDAVIGNIADQPNHVWLNDGAGHFIDSGQLLGNLLAYTVSLGDLDGDRDLDVFFGNEGYPNTVWFNDGVGVFSDSGQRLGDAYSRAALGDLDGDGDLDALSTRENIVWLNDGTGHFSAHPETDVGGSGIGVALGDLDGDADLDAFVANDGSANFVWLNNGAGNFSDSGQSLGPCGGRGVALGDLDGDGSLDAFVGVAFYEADQVWLNQPGAPDPAAEVTIAGPTVGMVYTTYAFTSTVSPPTATLPITYAWQATGQSPLTHTVGLSDSVAFTWSATGTQMITVTASNGGSPVTDTHAIIMSPLFVDSGADLEGVRSSSVAWGDYDNDGDLDILLTGEDQSRAPITRLYRNDGGAVFTDVGALLTDVYLGSVAWGDYDNDGDLDILLTGCTAGECTDSVTKVYRNDDGSFVDTGAALTEVSYSSAAWGDYDNDGDLDILITGFSESSLVSSEVYRNDGDGVFTDVEAGLTGAYLGSAAWGDVDNDGDVDILLTGCTTGCAERVTKVYRNDGGTFADAGASLVGVSDSSVGLGDYDSDGDLDILLAGSTGSGPLARIYRNDGGNAFADVGAALPQIYNGTSVAWGDTDNDGDLDVLLAGNTGSMLIARIYRNDGSDVFTDISGSTLAGVYYGPASGWGDYDNDGDLDILLTGEGTSNELIARVYRNDTASANSVPSAPTGLDVSVVDTTAAMGWSPAGDAQTPVDGLTYNLRVGTTPGGMDVVSPMAASSGFRRLPQLGNSNHGVTATLTNLAPGTYYWSVQAVDATWAGSPFASEDSFSVSMPVDTPVLLPISNADGNGDYRVDWDDVPYASSYTLEEDDNDQFTSPEVRYTGAGSEYQVSDQENGTWYYRGKAANASSSSPWSNIVSTTVESSALPDAYESDDTCAQANPITTDGSIQTHTFHDQGDDDWVRFDAQANQSYLIRVDNVGSRVDAVVMLFGTCDEAPLAVEDNAFGPTVQMTWDAPVSGNYYLHILQNDPAIYGQDTDYDLSVSADDEPPAAPRSLRAEAADQALIVQWNRSPEPDVTRYRIRWGPYSGGPYSGVDEADGADNTYYQITGLTNGTPYYVVLTALDFSGNESPFSVEIGAIPAPSADTTQPVASISRPSASPVYTTTVPYLSIGGTATDGGNNLSRVHVLNTANSAEGWDYSLSGSAAPFNVDNLPLALGDNLIQVTVYDGADNQGTASLTIHRLAGLNGAVVIVGGHNDTDSLQSNIDYLTSHAYQTFLDAGFGPEDIFYLSPSPQDADGDGLSDVISPTTPAHLQAALQWAADKVGPGIPFFLYLADHGEKEFFCADGCYGDGRLWSDQLDVWLDELEATSGCDLVNVIIEACHAGSFIDRFEDAAQSLSQEGRVIITATDRNHNAYASAEGALFSDAFFSAVAQSQSLLASFEQAQAAVELNTHNQVPWLDDNGDGLHNAADGSYAADRYISSFFGAIPPRITAASVSLLDGTGTISATVERGGEPLDTVWAAIYAPSYQEPVGTTLDPGVPLVELEPDPQQEGLYMALSDVFSEQGTYRVVLYAQDQAGHQAHPVLIHVGTHVIYLPVVMRP